MEKTFRVKPRFEPIFENDSVDLLEYVFYSKITLRYFSIFSTQSPCRYDNCIFYIRRFESNKKTRLFLYKGEQDKY
jgi:hypothetical protein